MADMANYWVRLGVDVTLATWNGAPSGDFYDLDERVRRVHIDVSSASRPLRTLSAVLTRVRKLRALLKMHRPDVVLSFIAENNVLTILAAARLPVRVVVSERAHPAHDTNVRPVWRLLRSVLYRWCDDVVAQTSETAQWLERKCATTVRVIPNGLRTLPALAEEREPVIVAVGRLVRQKGFDLLLRAFARVAAEFADWQIVDPRRGRGAVVAGGVARRTAADCPREIPRTRFATSRLGWRAQDWSCSPRASKDFRTRCSKPWRSALP